MHLADHDSLTGVLNRRGFEDAVATALATPLPLLLVFCDIDEFKTVNERTGTRPAAAPRGGRRLAAPLHPRRRRTRPPRRRRIRHPRRHRHSRHAEALRRRLTSALAAPFACTDTPIGLTASIGAVLTHPAEHQHLTAEEIIARADATMYTENTPARP